MADLSVTAKVKDWRPFTSYFDMVEKKARASINDRGVKVRLYRSIYRDVLVPNTPVKTGTLVDSPNKQGSERKEDREYSTSGKRGGYIKTYHSMGSITKDGIKYSPSVESESPNWKYNPFYYAPWLKENGYFNPQEILNFHKDEVKEAVRKEFLEDFKKGW